MLKLYTLDSGWAGGAVVVAASREEAIPLLRSTYGWQSDKEERMLSEIREHEIKPGLMVEFWGDH